MSNNYGNQSISSLKDEQRVRQRPAVIFGTNDIAGVEKGVWEIISNAIDEEREGYGSTIEIEVKKDGTICVKDDGRGVPMDWNEKEKQYNWELVFCTLYASGKYDSQNYGQSLGLNGLGATAIQYASEFMTVYSYREGKKYTMNFKKGRPDGKLQVEEVSGDLHGTEIIFRPDLEVFLDINIPIENYIDKLRRQAMLNPRIKIILKYEGRNPITLHYPEGTKGFLTEVCEKTMTGTPIYFYGEDTGDDEDGDNPYKLTMDVAFTFSRELSFVELYHNSGYMSDGGATFEACCAAILKVLEDVAKASGKIGKSERFSFKDLEEILVLIGSTNCPGHRTMFKNQTKTAINNPFIKKAYFGFVYYNFSRWVNENKQITDKIVAEVVANKDLRENAEAVKKKVINKLKASIDKFGDKPAKYVDCRSTNPFNREIYIVEGDSALGACKLARNGEFQALMPVRGKILNCLKEDLTRILKNEIIVDLLRVIGCGIEAGSKYITDLPKFDISKLNFGKIIICTDADLDGMQIRCLIITMIYRLMPTLLKKGKVFIAETPLFVVTAKNKAYFAYDEQEKNKIVSSLVATGLKESQITIERSKGLGENEPEMMSESTMNPATRRLVPIEYPENEEQLADLFDMLLGDNIEGRRYLIDEYFDIDVDIN